MTTSARIVMLMTAALANPRRLKLPERQLRELTDLAAEWANVRSHPLLTQAGLGTAYRIGCAEGFVAGAVCALVASDDERQVTGG